MGGSAAVQILVSQVRRACGRQRVVRAVVRGGNNAATSRESEARPIGAFETGREMCNSRRIDAVRLLPYKCLLHSCQGSDRHRPAARRVKVDVPRRQQSRLRSFAGSGIRRTCRARSQLAGETRRGDFGVPGGDSGSANGRLLATARASWAVEEPKSRIHARSLGWRLSRLITMLAHTYSCQYYASSSPPRPPQAAKPWPLSSATSPSTRPRRRGPTTRPSAPS